MFIPENNNNNSDSKLIKKNMWTLINPNSSTIDGIKNKKELKQLLKIF